MPRVLFVSYLFPPAGSVGVYRALRFLKWLPRLGWEPVVLTPRNARVGHIQVEPVIDAEGIEVHRTSSFEALNPGLSIVDGLPRPSPNVLVSGLRTLWKTVAVPDVNISWMPFAVTTGSRLLRSTPADVIFVTGKPFSSFWIADRLSRRFSVPWVMDLRDLWALNRRSPAEHWWQQVGDAQMERRLVARASQVVVNTPGNRREFLDAYPDESPHKFVTITNGYDRDDFGADVSKESLFTIAYTGTFYFPRDARGDARTFETHSPSYLFQALSSLFHDDPDMRARCRVVIAGPLCEPVRELAERHGVSDVVTLVGWVSHGEAIRLQQRAHLLLLALSSGETSKSWIPAKLFQYLGSGTAILALVPDGDAAHLVRRTGSGVVVPPRDVSAIKTALRRAYDRYRRGERIAEPSAPAVCQYEAESLTRRLAAVLTEAVSRSSETKAS